MTRPFQLPLENNSRKSSWNRAKAALTSLGRRINHVGNWTVYLSGGDSDRRDPYAGLLNQRRTLCGAGSRQPLEHHDLWLRPKRIGLARTAALSMEVHYCAWVEQSHEPAVTSRDFVVKDKLSSHKVQGVREVIESMGATQRYLPPYSPDCTPMVFASDVIAKQGVILLC